MIARERASLFAGEDDADFDVSGFRPAPPRPAPRPEEIAAVSDAIGFRSREPGPPKRPVRTGRSVQFNLKATQGTVELFRRLSEEQGWSLAVTLEKALDALERELAAQG